MSLLFRACLKYVTANVVDIKQMYTLNQMCRYHFLSQVSFLSHLDDKKTPKPHTHERSTIKIYERRNHHLRFFFVYKYDNYTFE